MPTDLRKETRTLVIDVFLIVLFALLAYSLSPEAWMRLYLVVHIILFALLLCLAVWVGLALWEQGKRGLFALCVSTGLGIVILEAWLVSVFYRGGPA